MHLPSATSASVSASVRQLARTRIENQLDKDQQHGGEKAATPAMVA